LILVIRSPEDGDVIKLSVKGLSPEKDKETNLGELQIGGVVTLDLRSLVCVIGNCSRDTVAECALFAVSASNI
jgi:hypothetical protein